MCGCLGWEWLSQLSGCAVGMPRVWLSQLGVAVTAVWLCCRHATCVAVSAGSALSQLSVCVVGMPRVWLSQLGVAVTAV